MRLPPDGKRLLAGEFDSEWHVIALPLEKAEGTDAVPRVGKIERILEDNHFDAGLSPDGKWLWHLSLEPNGGRVVSVRSFAGRSAKWQISGVEGGGSLEWSPKGRQIFYVPIDGRIRVVDYTVKGNTFEAGKPRIWSQVRVGTRRISITPDGKRFAVVMTPDSDATPEIPAFVMVNFLDEVRRKMRGK